jgi:Zn-dependent M16 (insulinase) family peptidase
MNLRDFGYQIDGSALVVNNLLRTSWLSEKVRVEGGAYGGFCSFDHITGQFTFLSYRDPNLLGTLDNYDGSAAFLKGLDLSEAEITRNVIGTVSDLDAYQLPDAKGWSATIRDLIGETDENRQRRRDQVLGTSLQDFRAFGDVLAAANATGQVCIVGASDAVEKANASKPGWLRVKKAL